MFGRDEVNAVMKALQKNVGFFASEAHFQMSFATEVLKLYKGRYDVVPEYPTKREINVKYLKNSIVTLVQEDKTDEIDLVVIDTNDNKKTYIEFKHKTANKTGKNRISETILGGIQITPKHHGAPELGQFDCWSDIERLLYYKKKVNECDNAFFILITNDKNYWNKTHNETFGDDFDMSNGSHPKNLNKKWNNWMPTQHLDIKKGKSIVTVIGTVDSTKTKISSIAQTRNRTINIDEDYAFVYETFNIATSTSDDDIKEFKQLVIEI